MSLNHGPRAVVFAAALATLSPTLTNAAPKKPKPPAAAKPPAQKPPPAPVYPARLTTFPCTASDPEREGRGRLTAAAWDIRSSALDRFSIRGEHGVFLCRPGVRALTTRGNGEGGSGSSLAVANYADAKGETSPRLFYMPETEARLQVILNRLQSAWPHPNAKAVKVRLAASSQFNAHAHPDDVIVVNVGVFATPEGMAENDLKDNDLYWILGHEYAHVGLRHATRGEALNEQSTALKNIASVYMEGAKLNSAFGYAEGSPLSGDLADQIRDAKAAQSQLQFTLTSVIHPAWGRANEDQADAAGFDLAAALGYFPRFELATSRFEASEKKLDDYVAQMKGRVNERVQPVVSDSRFTQALQQGEQGEAFKQLGEAVKKGFFKGARDLLTGWFSRDHRLAKSRHAGLTEYRAEAYMDAGRPLTPQIYADETRAIASSPEMKEAIIATASIEAAERDLMGGDAKSARGSIAPALNTRFRSESLTLYTAAKAADGVGNRAEAISFLERSRASRTVSPNAYAMLAMLYTKGNQAAKAKPVIAEGRSRTGDHDFFLPEDVRIAVRARDMETAAALMEQCRRSGRDLVSVGCVEAVMDVNWDKLTEKQQEQVRDLADYGASGKPNNRNGSDSFFGKLKTR